MSHLVQITHVGEPLDSRETLAVHACRELARITARAATHQIGRKQRGLEVPLGYATFFMPQKGRI
jgi:hypothetical protein